MQQRLCLAQTLVHDPQVLLLDEPASGLDPRARVEMRELLRELSKMGKTIVLSSHILSELADGPTGSAMCDVVGIIERGKMVASGPLATLRQQAQPGCIVRLHILSDVMAAAALLNRYPAVADVVHLNGNAGDEGHLDVYLTADVNAAADLLTHLVQHGVKIAEFRQRSNELEELFLHLTRPESR
jgi:ABC-2 type transport system ATP-binding protein